MWERGKKTTRLPDASAALVTLTNLYAVGCALLRTPPQVADGIRCAGITLDPRRCPTRVGGTVGKPPQNGSRGRRAVVLPLGGTLIFDGERTISSLGGVILHHLKLDLVHISLNPSAYDHVLRHPRAQQSAARQASFKRVIAIAKVQFGSPGSVKTKNEMKQVRARSMVIQSKSLKCIVAVVRRLREKDQTRRRERKTFM